MTTPDPTVDGAISVPADPGTLASESGWGFDSAGINDGYQPSEGASIDRHIIGE
jgi:hypothetical protein